MPIFNGRPESTSKFSRADARLRKGFKHQRLVWEKRDGVINAGARAEQPGTRELQFDVVAGGNLRGVRFHRCRPGPDKFRRRNINQHRSDIGRFSFGCHGVEKQLFNGMRVVRGAVLQAAEASQPGGIAHQFSQASSDRDADFQPDSGASTVPGRTRRIISANLVA